MISFISTFSISQQQISEACLKPSQTSNMKVFFECIFNTTLNTTGCWTALKWMDIRVQTGFPNLCTNALIHNTHHFFIKPVLGFALLPCCRKNIARVAKQKVSLFVTCNWSGNLCKKLVIRQAVTLYECKNLKYFKFSRGTSKRFSEVTLLSLRVYKYFEFSKFAKNNLMYNSINN